MIVVRDEEIVQKALDEMPLPEQVERIITEFGSDWAGDPAVFIYVMMQDALAADDKAFYAQAEQLRENIGEVVAKTGVDRWPYVNFRTVSEQREIEQEVSRASKR